MKAPRPSSSHPSHPLSQSLPSRVKSQWLLGKSFALSLSQYLLISHLSGARGLGLSIADALCDVNLASLVIFDVLKEHGNEAVQFLSKKFRIPVVFKQVDVTDHGSVKGAVDAVCFESILLSLSRLYTNIASGHRRVRKNRRHGFFRWDC
jgi:hypothetical protein